MNNMSGYVITIIAFSFFILCPRMGAMINILDKNTNFPLYWLVIIGTLGSVPLLLLMAWIIKQWGLVAGLALAVLTDLLAAVVLKSVSTKAAIETFIIALFVIVGNRIATLITAKFF